MGDDAPKGNYAELKKYGAMPEVSAAASFRSGAINVNTWFLFIQYACCFGVELTMNNAAALYFKDEFGQSTICRRHCFHFRMDESFRSWSWWVAIGSHEC